MFFFFFFNKKIDRFEMSLVDLIWKCLFEELIWPGPKKLMFCF